MQLQADQLGTAPAGQTPVVGQWEPPNLAAVTQYYSTQACPRLGKDGFGAGQVLTVAYYDDDNFNHDAAGQPDLSFDNRYAGQFPAGAAPAADARTTGLPTRTQNRVRRPATRARG